MTFLKSAKYVGYGFFGMALFGLTVNKVFASESGVSGYCYLDSGKEMLICGKTADVESIDTYCLPLSKSKSDGILFICTKDQEDFTSAYRKRRELLEGENYYHGEGNGEKALHKPSHSF